MVTLSSSVITLKQQPPSSGTARKMVCASSRDALEVTAPLRLAARIAPGPTDHSVTHVDDICPARTESLGPHQCECADIRVRHFRLQSCCRGKQGSPLGNDVVDKYQPVNRRDRRCERERLIVLPDAGPPAVWRRRGFLDSGVASQPRAHRRPKTHVPERNGELQRRPERPAVPGSASRYRNQQRAASEQRGESPIAEARPEHKSCVARKPRRIGRLHSPAYSTRRLCNRSHTSRYIRVTRDERQSLNPKPVGISPGLLPRFRRFTGPGRPSPAVETERSRVRGRFVRSSGVGRETGRRPSPPPSISEAATPRAPDAVSPRHR